MLNKFKETIQQAGDAIKEQASALGDVAKEKGFQIIEQWVSILPALEEYGFKVIYFAMSVSLNPQLEVEMQAKPEQFRPERIEELLKKNQPGTTISMVLNTVKTTWRMYEKVDISKLSPLTVKISVRLSPEIKVMFGRPLST